LLSLAIPTPIIQTPTRSTYITSYLLLLRGGPGILLKYSFEGDCSTLVTVRPNVNMPYSLESARPILTAARYCSSLCSYPLSTTSSICSADDLRFAEIEFQLKRLEDSRLQRQRFVPSEKKFEMMSKLALGAKLDRALQRRMTGQDALPKGVSNAPSTKVQ